MPVKWDYCNLCNKNNGNKYQWMYIFNIIDDFTLCTQNVIVLGIYAFSSKFNAEKQRDGGSPYIQANMVNLLKNGICDANLFNLSINICMHIKIYTIWLYSIGQSSQATFEVKTRTN